MAYTRTATWQGGKWASNGKRWAIYLRDGLTCVYCGEVNKLSLDHVTPHNHGGNNEPTNLITACASCNYSRQDKTLRCWLRWLRDNKGLTVEQTRRIAARIRRLTQKGVSYSDGREYYLVRKIIRCMKTAANDNTQLGTFGAIVKQPEANQHG